MTKKTRTALLIVLWTLTLLWTFMLFGFSGQDGPESADLSMRFTLFVLELFPSLPFTAVELEPVMRKIAHFAIFAAEGALMTPAMILSLRRFRPGALLTLPICAGIAVLNEIHQSFAEARNCSAWDMLLDACGAAAGIAFIALAIHLARRRNAIIS